MRAFVISCLFLVLQVSAWTPLKPQSPVSLPTLTSKEPASNFDPFHLGESSSLLESPTRSDIQAMALASLALGTPTFASAATAFSPNAVPAALAAYGHYLSLLGILACIMIERLTIKPNMSEKEEDLVAFADTGLGVWGVLIAYTGYLRSTSLEKGFDFYSHEPLFWLKICFVGVFGAGTTYKLVEFSL